MDGLTFVASLVNAIAWPLVVVGIVFVLRDPIKKVLLGRGIRSLTVGPFRVEFEPLTAATTVRLARPLRGLSLERMEVEVDLFDAILRLQTARALYGVVIPPELEDSITTFWTVPESIGLRPGGEEDVRTLIRAIVAYLPPNLMSVRLLRYGG